jgi:hypothetical protein
VQSRAGASLGNKNGTGSVAPVLSFTQVPNFLKHADKDPDAFLAEHSDKSAHTTLLFAVLLYAANGGEETPYMRPFVKSDDPYMEGYKLKKIARLGGLGAQFVRRAILTQGRY